MDTHLRKQTPLETFFLGIAIVLMIIAALLAILFIEVKAWLFNPKTTTPHESEDTQRIP